MMRIAGTRRPYSRKRCSCCWAFLFHLPCSFVIGSLLFPTLFLFCLLLSAASIIPAYTYNTHTRYCNQPERNVSHVFSVWSGDTRATSHGEDESRSRRLYRAGVCPTDILRMLDREEK